MRFLLYNIRYGTGHGTGYHRPFPFSGFFKKTDPFLEELVGFIRSVDPDVVGLVEVDSGSYRSHSFCQVGVMAGELGYHCVMETKYGKGCLADKVPVMNKQGNGILSREEVVSKNFYYFDEGVKRLIIEVELADIFVFLVHLSLKKKHRQQQLERLRIIVSKRSKPVILAGDFNTFRGEKEIQNFLDETGLINANIEGRPSYPSIRPRKQLDYILHSRELAVSGFSIPTVALSDHAPLVCDLQMVS